MAAFFCLLVLVSQSPAQAPGTAKEPTNRLPPVLTQSPRDTMQSLLRLHDELISAYRVYKSEKSAEDYARLTLIGDALISLLGMPDETVAARRETGVRTALALIDIIDEVDPEQFDSLPDSDAALLSGRTSYSVSDTPLVIQRMDDGPRAGEYLFSPNSLRVAPRYLREVATQSPDGIEGLWSTRFLQLSGPLIPFAVENALPSALRSIVWGTPIWKVLAAGFLVLMLAAILFGLNRALKRRTISGKMRPSASELLFSCASLTALHSLNEFFNDQLFLTGDFARSKSFIATVAIYTVLAVTFWRLMAYVNDVVAQRKASIVRHYDESMMRLVNHLIALIGAIWILAYGAQTLGFPLLSILAGLGVGGLAVALAIRPTLENLISGFVIYIEKAVKVGDYCSFPGQEGTIESIGIRSTHIRGLDRTTIAIPNSRFVNMDLINWARCDEMMIRTTLGLRYETDTDQLRYVLAQIRTMMYAHPKITSQTARVRFVGYDASSLNIEIRVYAKTREWNEFYAIQEDVLFRVKEIVGSSGTSFAFPSQTVYMSKDAGLDASKSTHAVDDVKRWRRRHDLPFPEFSSANRERLESTLRYPPYGSPEFDGPDEDRADVEEPLSVDEPLSAEETADEDTSIKDNASTTDASEAAKMEAASDDGKSPVNRH